MVRLFVAIPVQQAELQDVGLLALRLSIGILFVVHGYPKLSGESRRKEIDLMKGYGVPKAVLNVVGTYEFGGGLLLTLGLLTRIVSSLFATLMVAIILFNITKMSLPPVNKRYINGWDRDTVLLAGAILMVIAGPGIYSGDFALNL